MAKRPPHEVLGVARDATREQVRRAYRTRAKELHPDVNASGGAAAAFAELQRAYEALGGRPAAKRVAADHAESPAGAGGLHVDWTNVASPRAGAGSARRKGAARRVETDSLADEVYEAFFVPRQRAREATSQRRADG